MQFGILLTPHSNKRYSEATKNLSINELIIVSANFQHAISDIEFITPGGLELLSFKVQSLTETEQKTINLMSSCFALFEITPANTLIPMLTANRYYFKDDISGILKYKGKTNEIFTDLMLNIAVFSSSFHQEYDTPLNILDPMCGKGTTLFQGLIKGYNTFGIEIDKKEIAELNTFFKKYLEFNKYKHYIKDASIMEKGKKIAAKYLFETANSTENYKNDNRRLLQFACGDSISANQIYPQKESMHCIVTDLPYGIHHNSSTGYGKSAVEDVLEASLPAWNAVLKSGGTVVLSYNTHNLKKANLEKIFSEFGYQVLNTEPYNRFEHWVEQAVNRDIFVAKKR